MNHIASKIRFSKLFAVILFTISVLRVSGQVSFSYRSSYFYLKGKDAGSLVSTWMNPGYNYTTWPLGDAPFRYGDGAWGTELTDMQNSYTTVYLRSVFNCASHDKISELTLTADYDDGFVIWINGVKALTVNAPAVLSNTGVAPANHESGTGVNYKIPTTNLNLSEGINYLAVQVFNVSLASTDLYFDLEITGEIQAPEYPDPTARPSMSANSGFYDVPFNLSVTSPDTAASIIYTLDGSNPQTSLTADTSASQVIINTDPASSVGRAATPGFMVRASLFKPGYKPSRPVTRTFIYIENVKTQGFPGGGWPSTNINGQLIDLAMDSRVVTDPLYSALIDDSFIDIPSISIVTEIGNLFDPVRGIYVNADGHGFNWERECNAELIRPDGAAGFSIDAGLRIRGGYSRHDGYPKHSFRLFFREEYGYDKLYYPLFENEGAAVFDKIDLRSEQNYSWNNGGINNSFVREVFSRDTQRDMGDPYTRSRYYHLWLNGMYWGLFQTQERSEARYAATYFGDNDLDYDVVKVNTENWQYTVEATDGNLLSWNRLWTLCQGGFASAANYFVLEGKDKSGNPVKGGEVMVDIDNLIDYMLVVFYTGNFDAPTSSFMQNKGSNNFYAIDNREDRSTGFKFFAHDAEHSLFDEAHSPGIGLYEDRVNIGSRTDNYRMDVTTSTKFHPQWLHHKLSASAEYRLRFADRAYRFFSTGGALSPEKVLERLNDRISQVDLAVIAESARWGDSKRTGTPYTRNANWIPELNKLKNNFVPLRGEIVKTQLRTAGLYPELAAPVIKKDGTFVTADKITLSSPSVFTMVNPSGNGIIYYTLNGMDPRQPGGQVYQGALFSYSTAVFTLKKSSLIKARILSGGQWGPLRELNVISNNDSYSDLKITEISYHPPDIISGYDTVSGQNLEFIEFKNTGSYAINLKGLSLDSAVTFTFSDDLLIPPGRFIVLASDRKSFYNYYGLIPTGVFNGNLSNSGDRLLVKDNNGATIYDFTYHDDYPWPGSADGEGYTLTSVVRNPEGDPSSEEFWKSSFSKWGSPFADDDFSNPEEPVIPSKGKLLTIPNPTSGLLSIRLVSSVMAPEMNLSVYNSSGLLIKKMKVANPLVSDLKELGLSPGVYIIRCTYGGYDARARVVYVK